MFPALDEKRTHLRPKKYVRCISEPHGRVQLMLSGHTDTDGLTDAAVKDQAKVPFLLVPTGNGIADLVRAAFELLLHADSEDERAPLGIHAVESFDP